jgi:hypothetical protein
LQVVVPHVTPVDVVPLDVVPLEVVPLDVVPLDVFPLDVVPLDVFPLDPPVPDAVVEPPPVLLMTVWLPHPAWTAAAPAARRVNQRTLRRAMGVPPREGEGTDGGRSPGGRRTARRLTKRNPGDLVSGRTRRAEHDRRTSEAAYDIAEGEPARRKRVSGRGLPCNRARAARGARCAAAWRHGG